MKVLIVDDENHVIDAIVLLVPWEELGISQILTALSVSEANAILAEERPEIAIVDVVIGDLLGTEILAYINELQLQTKVIVISGYDDYEYIRNMFVLGGLDYLLKPIEQKPLIAAVITAIQKVLKSSCERDGRPVALSDYQRSLYRSLLLTTSHDVIYTQICDNNPKVRAASVCQVLYADCFFLPVWSEDYLLKLNQTLDRIRQGLEAADSGTLFQISNTLTDVVILLYADFTASLELISKCIRSFNYGQRSSICFGLSAQQNLPEGIRAALQQARQAADSAQILEKREVISYNVPLPESRKLPDMKYENRLFAAMIAGNSEQIDVALRSWFSDVCGRRKRGIQNRGEMRLVWEQFQFLYEKLNRYFADQYNGYRSVAPPQVRMLETAIASGMESEAMLAGIFKDSLDRISLEKKKLLVTRSKMREIADYLELNYDSRIQQAECANLFHLNKDYMSRKFKEEMGIGMAQYMNRIRLNKAKELLTGTDKSIQEISDNIGFIDQKYFSKQFRRETGFSPTEYRLWRGFITEHHQETGG